MELNSDGTVVFCQTCVCGRSFYHPGPLKYHQRGCSKNKRRWASVLEKAKETWISRKKRRLLDMSQADGPGETPHVPDAMGVDGVNTKVCALQLPEVDSSSIFTL